MKIQRQEFAIEWAHCDAAGIVFYPNFYIWFDQATERLFTANRLSYAELERDFGITGMPLVETGTNYRNPSKLGDVVAMRSWVDEWNGRSFLVRHVIELADGEIGLEGFERRVLIRPDPQSAKGIAAIRIPDELMQRFID
jgi:4-hydroxybenzoyl-CoA thioesterase